MESRAYPTATQPTSPLLHAPTPRRQAAILIPLCHLEIEDGEPLNTLRTPALLFTVRSLQLRSHAGEVSFPGGAHDPEHDGEFPDRNDMAAHTAKFPEVNDDNIQTISYWDAVAATLGRTAVRETREEVPSIGDVRILGRLPHVLDKSQTIEVHPFVGYGMVIVIN